MSTELKKKPRVGLAFSGANARSVFYIGFLEVLQEYNIPIDIIGANSSSSIVAASFACGTLPELKNDALALNKGIVFNLLEKSKVKGGYYSLNKVEEFFRKYTHGKTFEEVKPSLIFAAVDLEKGEEVPMGMGDIARAARISCTMPGIFEPVRWGSKTLIDGGLLNVIPGKLVRDNGADIVIGVDMRGNRHLFTDKQIYARKLLNKFKQKLFPGKENRMVRRITDVFEDTDLLNYFKAIQEEGDDRNMPGLFTILGRSLDLAIQAQVINDPKNATYNCDLVIIPTIPKPSQWEKYTLKHMTNFTDLRMLYNLGKTTAREYMPQIKKLITEKSI